MHGLQVWDENGNLQIDTSTKTSTVIKVVEVTANKTYSYTNDLFSTDNFFYLIAPYGRWVSLYISVTLVGSTVTIITNRNLAETARVVLGVY